MNGVRAPRMSIGLPVYNGEEFVGRAIESLLRQEFADFELIVSDNASTDRSGEILAGFAARDERIRYIRQASNVGGIGNFGFVLEQASAGYFMWAAADDCWAPEFLKENIEFLDAHPDYVASVSQAAFDDAATDPGDVMGTFPLTGTARENLQAFILNPGADTRFYAVHRTQIIRRAWIPQPFWASDWAMVCRTLEFGKYHEVPRVLMTRSYHGASSNAYRTITRFDLGWLRTSLPFLHFTRWVLRIPPARNNLRVLVRLLWLNLDGMLMVLKKRIGG